MNMKYIKAGCLSLLIILVIVYVIPTMHTKVDAAATILNGPKESDIYTNETDIDALDTSEMDDYLDNYGEGTIKVNYVGSVNNGSDVIITENKAAIKFDISGVSGDVTDAKLKIKIVDIVGNPYVNLISTDRDFLEAATGSTFPTYNPGDIINDTILDTPYVNRVISPGDLDGNGWYTFNVKDYVKDKIDASATHITFVLTGPVNEGDKFFNFINNQETVLTAQAPKLEIVTGMVPPNVTGTTPTNDSTPTWSWTSGGGSNGSYRYKLDNNDFSSEAIVTTGTSFTPEAPLGDGVHTVYVQESNGAGGWSMSGSRTITVDTTPPAITSSTAVAANNTYIDVTFSDPVREAGDGTTLISPSKFSVNFLANRGTATGASISAIKRTDGATAVDGTETTMRFFLAITGTPSGVETIEIKPADGTSIYDKAGNAMPVAQTTGVKILNDKVLPTLVSAARTDNTHITVTLSENCTNIAKANDGGFAVEEKGTPATTYAVTSIAQGADASHVVLTVADMAVSDQKGVSVKYTAGGNGTIQDVAGNTMATNNTGVVIAPWNVPPPPLSPTPTPTPTPTTGPVSVDEEIPVAVTIETEEVEGKTVTTVTIDSKLEDEINNKDESATIIIDLAKTNEKPDVVVCQLNGQMVKEMEYEEAVLKIRTEDVTYTLPTTQINIDAVSEEMGENVKLKDIIVGVRVAAPPEDTVKIVEDTVNRNNYQVVVKPVKINIICTNNNQTVEVSNFNGYIERTVAIPEGVDPSKITTGIVLNEDGTFSHVPAAIIVIDGKYYAKINELR